MLTLASQRASAELRAERANDIAVYRMLQDAIQDFQDAIDALAEEATICDATVAEVKSLVDSMTRDALAELRGALADRSAE